MRKSMSKTEAQNEIKEFFQQGEFDAEKVRKIKRLAMKHRIKLGSYKKSFCKKCFSQLKGKIRINSGYKIVECSVCRYKNRFKL